jgi:hypothetical protein
MGMIEEAEGEYTELLRKRKVVENDKKKIKSVIGELDVKKKTELERTWKKVNKDFGSIFSTLLPGAFAKLCNMRHEGRGTYVPLHEGVILNSSSWISQELLTHEYPTTTVKDTTRWPCIRDTGGQK